MKTKVARIERPSILDCQIRLFYKTVKNARRVVRRMRKYHWAMIESGFFREQSPIATERLCCIAVRDVLLKEMKKFISVDDDWMTRYYNSEELKERIEPVWEKMTELHEMKKNGTVIELGAVREAVYKFFDSEA